MEYVIPIVLVVLAVAGFVTFLMLNATRKSGAAAAGDEGAPGIGGDRTPLGDTSEHADHEPAAGRRPADPDDAAHVGRRGEAEGAEELEFEGRRPQPGGEDADARADRLRREQAEPASETARGPRRLTFRAAPCSGRVEMVLR